MALTQVNSTLGHCFLHLRWVLLFVDIWLLESWQLKTEWEMLNRQPGLGYVGSILTDYVVL